MIPIDSAENGFKDFVFYDIEVFKHWTLVVFKDINKNTLGLFNSDTGFNGLIDFIKGKILVGYNNYNYDDFILTSLLQENASQTTIKAINDNIMNGMRPGIEKDRSIESLDCFQQINVAKSSLKKIEANLGLSIEETEVDFDLDRELTEDEKQRTIKYCCHDVEATIDIFKLRWYSYFVPKLTIISMLDKSVQEMAIKWNTTTITAQLLMGNTKAKRWRYYRLEEVEPKYKVPKEVLDMWNEAEAEIAGITGNHNFKGGKVSVDSMDCLFEFGFGGLHGVANSGMVFEDVKLLDVASMYPNIIINIDALGEPTRLYKQIVERRLKIKHSDKQMSDALKLVINATYGLLKNRYSKLMNPIAGTSVTITGQKALYDLCGRLRAEGFRLVNVNTDGVAFTGNIPDSRWEAVKEQWEKDYGLTLELSRFKKWVQKDVNNYIALTSDGDVKVKGGDVNKYHDALEFTGDLLHSRPGVTWTGTNSVPIISHCVVEYVLHGTEPLYTILDNLDKPLLFQLILQAGNTYEGTFDADGNKYQRVNRVFASKKDGVTLVKRKPDGSINRYPDAPEKMYVYNGDLSEFNNFNDIVDINYYVKLAESVCERWTSF